MEEPKAVVVLDISSDEEADCVDIIRGIRKLLDDDDDDDDGKAEGLKDDSVLEVCVNLKKFSSDDDDDDDDDDDECVVLDADPDKPRMVENVYGNNDDDLVLVSEKGEIACRDFPHPRHLCAKYPFSSSRHDMCCDQCHCYVCELLAPCAAWGTGVSSFDHCHASDKQAFWTSQRMSLRNAKLPVPILVPPDHHIATSTKRPPMPDRTAPLQIACRILPHPRPLCAKYPFSSSRHDMCCDQCYCYVCELLAPCAAWGTGVSSFDHCHASDKQAFWTSQRMTLRNAKLPVPILVPPDHHIATSTRSPPMPDRTSPLVPNLVHQNRGLRPETNSVNVNHDKPCIACGLGSVRWNGGRPCMACIFNKRSGSGDSHLSDWSSPLVPNLVPQNQGLGQLETTVNSVNINRGMPCMACSLSSGRWNCGTPCMACIFSERSGDSHTGASQNK